MPPKSSPPVQPELFRSALVNFVDPKHPLVRLAGLIDWERFRTAFGPLSCDGQTLAAEIVQTERITGVTIERASVDRGDRGHDAQDRRSGETHKSRVFLAGQRRGVTPTIRREIRQRAGIEPVIGHMKADGHLGRNFLAGAAGDAITLILAAAGHTLRLLRAWLARLLAFLLSLLAISATAPPLPSPQLARR
jgi:IS5 family transposase